MLNVKSEVKSVKPETRNAKPETPTPVAPVERVRQTETMRPCPECHENAAVVTSAPRSHPRFITNRTRYMKCRKCEHTFKVID